MSGKYVSFWLLFLGSLYLALAINTLFGFLLSESDTFLGIVILVNSGIYLFGLAERKEDERRRVSHLLVGSFFSYFLGIYQVIMVLSVWLEGILTGMCLLSLETLKLPIILAGFSASFLPDFIRKNSDFGRRS